MDRLKELTKEMYLELCKMKGVFSAKVEFGISTAQIEIDKFEMKNGRCQEKDGEVKTIKESITMKFGMEELNND